MSSKLTIVRGNCADGETCPVVARPVIRDGELRFVGIPITDPAELAELRVGPGEAAFRMPAALFPEIADAD